MKNNTFKTLLLFFIILIISIVSCQHYVNHNFRKTYTDYNTYIHNDSTNVSYLKVHFKNGDVCVLEDWHLDKKKEYLIGRGTLYDFNRTKVVAGASLSFEINSIAIIETNQLEEIKAKDNERIAALSILAGIDVIIGAACLANPKACFGSCPTFYLEGQYYFHEAGAEGFSSAVSPALEKADIDALQFKTKEERLTVTMKNEALETHAVNQVKILSVLAKKNQNVYHNKEGQFFVCNTPIQPKKATANGKNIKSSIKTIDAQEYFSVTDTNDLSAKEELMFEFDSQPSQQYGLVVNFRQTQLTTFLFYSSLGYMGDEAGDYFALIERNPLVKKKLEDLFSKLGEINVYYWDEKKENWTYLNDIFETGPIAKNLQIVQLSENFVSTKSIKIKIEISKGAWRVDYVALAPIAKEVEAIEVLPFDVVNENKDSEELLTQITKDDNEYLVSFPGDIYTFNFELPTVENDNYHHLFLSSKGYYLEWVRDSWLKEKNVMKLKKMLLNNEGTWQDLAKEFKVVEHEMEELFWASKYEGEALSGNSTR